MDSTRRYRENILVGKPANRNSLPKSIILKKIGKWGIIVSFALIAFYFLFF
jgi:hypothetical protein